MSCDGAYATPEDFLSFFCQESRISRVHDGAAGAAVLTDSMAHFVSLGVEAGVGMIVYNVTDGSQGVVTAVTETTITATLSGGTDNDWDPGDEYLIVTINAFDRSSVSHYLEVTASDVASALAAQDACECSLSPWGAAFLMKLNIIDAASFITCGCMTKLSDTERQQYRNWMSAQLELLRTGKLDVCQGGTGSDYPAFGNIERAVTDFAAARIIANSAARNRL